MPRRSEQSPGIDLAPIGFEHQPFPAVAAAFNSLRARPRVIRAWHPATGATKVPHRPRLTLAEVDRLREAGYSIVILRWRGRRRTMALVSGSARSIWRGVE